MQKKQIVDLNARAREQRGNLPGLGAGVTDSKAVGYAAGIQARRGGLPKYTSAVAGGDPPPMPALEQPHQVGMTMAAQADMTRRSDAARHAATAVAVNSGAGSIISRDVQQAAPAAPDHVASPQDLVLLPQDLLPPGAAKDPMYQQGAGSRMALSQPHMAAKYGVVRGGRVIPPQELVRGAAFQAAPGQQGTQRKMRPAADIAADLQKAMAAPPGSTRRDDQDDEEEEGVSPPSHLPRTDAEAVEQAKANVAARAGAAPIPSVLDPDASSRMGLTDEDLASLQREMIRDILRDPGQKETVEARCKPLNIEELIMTNTVQQRVPILPGQFEPTFESMRGDVELALKRLLVAEGKSITVTESYLLDKYAVMTTAAGLVKINNMPVPTLFDTQGEFNDDLFWAKFNWVLKRPIHMLASLGIHYAWFEQRVRKLFKASEGKGG